MNLKQNFVKNYIKNYSSIYQFITPFLTGLIHPFFISNNFFFFDRSRKKKTHRQIFIYPAVYPKSSATHSFHSRSTVKNRMKKNPSVQAGFKRTTTLFDPLNPV